MRRVARGVGVGVVAGVVDLDLVPAAGGQLPVGRRVAAVQGREADEDARVPVLLEDPPVAGELEVAEGLRALWISLAALAATAAFQAVIVAVSGSVALLGDTLHNAADALTAVPLGIAFVVGRRPAKRRYTYGYGRAEDLAGIVIVVLIAASSALAAYEAIDRLAHPRPVSNLAAVGIAASLAATVGVPGVGAGHGVAEVPLTTSGSCDGSSAC